jgi:ribulose bisphosphate carboxylase small subunit
MNATQAKQECLSRGYTFEKKEDREGKTKSGWWCDDVFLAKTAEQALKEANG